MTRPKSRGTKPLPQPGTEPHDAQAEAAALFQKLEKERGKATISLNKAVKGYPTRAAIFAARPEVHVEFVRLVVKTVARLGKSTGKVPETTAWFHELTVPYGAEEVAKQLMRRRLPFSDAMLAEMLEQIGQMEFLTFAPVLEPLIRELEHRRKEGVLTPKVRKLLPRVISGLLVEGWSEEEKENWGMPRPTDLKLARRLKTLC